jgi:hypothetical protein
MDWIYRLPYRDWAGLEASKAAPRKRATVWRLTWRNSRSAVIVSVG